MTLKNSHLIVGHVTPLTHQQDANQQQKLQSSSTQYTLSYTATVQYTLSYTATVQYTLSYTATKCEGLSTRNEIQPLFNLIKIGFLLQPTVKFGAR